MTEKRMHTTKTIGERRGFPIYLENPTLQGKTEGQKRDGPPHVIKEGNSAMIINGATGEQLTGEGSIAFVEDQEVDAKRFVKIYLAALDGMFDLTKTGQRVFKLLWRQVQDNPNSDRVEMTHYIVETHAYNMSERVLQKGVRELLEKHFIFMSSSAGMYFFNVNFMFNGNRIITAQRTTLKGSQQQLTLALNAPE